MRTLIFWLILAYTALLPFERVLALTETESVFKPYRIAAMIAGVCWGGWLLTRKRKYRPDYGDKSYAVIFAYGVLMAVAWNMLQGTPLANTGDALPLVLLAFSMYVIVKDLRLSEAEVARVLLMHTVALFAAGSLALAREGFSSDRFRGLYKNPNQLGVAAGISFLYWLSRFLFAPSTGRPTQLFRVACAALSLGLIVLSGSRGAVVAVLVGTVVIVIFTLLRRRSFAARARILLFAAMLVGLAYPAVDRFADSFEETQSGMRFQRGMAEQSATERSELWHSGMVVGLEHYGLGVGMMQYLSYHQEVTARVNPRARNETALGTHSDYVDLFASYGLLGLVIYLAYMVSMVWKLTRAARAGAVVAVMGLALLVHNMVISISQNSFTGGEYFLTVALIDTIVGLTRRPAQEAPAQAKAPARTGVTVPA